MQNPAMRLLCTGFEPFDGSPLNPSREAVQALAERWPELSWTRDGAHELITDVLPVRGGVAATRLRRLFDRARPDAALLLGESGAASAITLERVGINLRDYRIPDNGGKVVRDRPVVAGGPPAYFATLPIRALEAALRTAGIPVELSHSAGTFLCNEVLYALLHHAATRRAQLAPHAGPRIGFVHLPRLSGQGPGHRAAKPSAPRPSMDLATMVRALEAIAAVLATSGRRPSAQPARRRSAPRLG